MSNEIEQIVVALDSKLIRAQEAVFSKIKEAVTSCQEAGASEKLLRSIDDIGSEFKSFITEIRSCISDVKSLFADVHYKLDDQESYSRRNCILLHGIQETQNECVEDLVQTAVNSLKIPNWSLSVDMIDRCHRIGPKEKAVRPILVKFISYANRHKIWVNKKKCKGKKFYFTESLTKIRMALYKQCKENLPKASIWTNDGRIYILMEDGSKKVITNADQLKKIISSLEETDNNVEKVTKEDLELAINEETIQRTLRSSNKKAQNN